MTTNNYRSIYSRSIEQPQDFWAEIAEKKISWFRKWDSVLDESRRPFYRWFRGGELNTCYNALDRHVDNGRGNQTALIHDSPVTGTVRKYTYAALRDAVSRFAGAIRQQGVEKGDRVIIYMPMIPEAAIAMLACARIGAIHSVVFGGFAAHELATRIDDARPKLVLSASCGIEPSHTVEYKSLLDRAITMARYKPEKTVIYQRPAHRASMIAGRDLDWNEIFESATPVDCVPVSATDPLYILYTSGTTGQPKGIVRDNGGHAVALCWSMKNIYGVSPGEVYWAASDIGWVVGHSYIIYGPLLHGNTSVMFEGKPVGTPDPGAFWRVISEHEVRVLFTAPTAFRAIKRDDFEGKYIGKYDLSNFRTLFLAGERCDPDTLHWAEENLNVPVIDHWWQTETGWAIAANCMGIEPSQIKPGSSARAVPGYSVSVMSDDGNELKAGDIGNIVIRLPLPPGCLPTLWNADQLYLETYLSRYPGYYLTGDAGYCDEDCYLWIMSRIDDIINTAGHRLSTGAMEEAISFHKDVAECAVVGVYDEIKGEVPVGLVVLRAGAESDEEDIAEEVVGLVREEIGPIASFKTAMVVTRLPKTRSGKILRGTIRKMANGEEYNVPATIDDPSILEEISRALKKSGYPVKR